MRRIALGLFFVCYSFSGLALSASVVSDNFDADIGTWVANTTQTTVSHSPTGGNPDGYLRTTNDPSSSKSFNAVGAVNTTPDYSGVFADGLWTVSVDLLFERGDFVDSWLRFRFQDATANGWHISLEDTVFSPTDWQSYSVIFDTTWDDATAMANGWVKENDGTLTASPAFAMLWDDVYTSEVRFLGQNESTLYAGIDNYNASVVPIPAAAWLFGSALLGLIGYRRHGKVG